MELRKKAIFIDEIEVEDNKFLLFFILDDGVLLKLNAQGLNKIESKNRNNLHWFSICEIDFFPNKNNQGGKLKKVQLLKKKEIKNREEFFALKIVSDVIKRENNWNSNIYKYLDKIILNKSFGFDEIIRFFIQILIYYKYEIEITKCSNCKSKSNISYFSLFDNGLTCKNCSKKDNILNANLLEKIILLFDDTNKFIHFEDSEKTLIKNNLIEFFNDVLGINIGYLKFI